jgi:hypothetical protein
MRVRQKAMGHVIHVESPILHVRKDLGHRVAAAAVEHHQSVRSLQNVRVSVMIGGVRSVPGHPVHVTANLIQIPQDLHTTCPVYSHSGQIAGQDNLSEPDTPFCRNWALVRELILKCPAQLRFAEIFSDSAAAP